MSKRMLYRDVTGLDVLLRLPRIQRNEVRYLWRSGYWDGPQSGMPLYKDRQFWFDNPEDYWLQLNNEELSDYAYPRRFLIVELSELQIDSVNSWHDLYRKYVGTRIDYDEIGNPLRDDEQPRRYDLFEMHWKSEPLNLLENPVVGWFEDRSIARWMALPDKSTSTT